MKYREYFTDTELAWSGYQFHKFLPHNNELWENKFTGAMLILRYDYVEEKYGVLEAVNTPFKVK